MRLIIPHTPDLDHHDAPGRLASGLAHVLDQHGHHDAACLLREAFAKGAGPKQSPNMDGEIKALAELTELMMQAQAKEAARLPMVIARSVKDALR